MPRDARLLLSQSYYHVMTRGNNRNTVFRISEDYDYYLHLIRRFKTDHPFDLYHYCLMPNHTHFLLKTNKSSDFSTFMKKLNLSYFYHYKKQYGWVGYFWQDRYKSQSVGKDEYFIQCGKYIELNPIRAGITDQPESYPYSSLKYYDCGIFDNLITEDFIYSGMGKTASERQKHYRNITIDAIVMDSYLKKTWGSDYQRYNESRKNKYHNR